MKPNGAKADHVVNNGVQSQGVQGESEESESQEDDVCFPQDVLFTNAKSDKPTQQNQLSPPIPTAGGIVGDNQEFEKMRGHFDMIMPNEDENYVKLRQELDDSNVYFLNQLRREIDNEDHFSRLYAVDDDMVKSRAHDQTTFNGISVFMNGPPHLNEKRHSIGQQQMNAAKGDYMFDFSKLRKGSIKTPIKQN